ncbi:hypothetical protein [Xanthomonas arboricola]|uniref:hypothetical protein n=1 Tax=Xanthomonas arboricola TaxID=56448 RepID=UPI003EBD4924
MKSIDHSVLGRELPVEVPCDPSCISHNVYYVKALAALVAFVCCCGHAAAATMARQMEIGRCVIDN